MTGNGVELHVPVMRDEVLACLRPKNGGVYVDATLGLGGHAEAVLRASAPAGRLIGFEWDREAVELTGRRLAGFADRLTICHLSYAKLAAGLTGLGIRHIDGLLADLGVSSLQFDRPERGFSFRGDGPIDMRMDTDTIMDAAAILARASEEEMADIFYHYGEERQARRIAAHICKARAIAPLTTTRQLADLVARAVPRRFHPEKIHVATRVFQALRIAVNHELDNLVRLLADGPGFLRPGAVFCIITFHSLEDRIVKQAFRRDERLRPCPVKPVRPTKQEVSENPRARSASLRCALRVSTREER